MTTLDALVERTRLHLFTDTRPELNKLSDNINASVDSVPLQFSVGGAQRGAALSIGSEDMYVWSAESNSVTVQRGMNGSTAAAHTDGDLVYVNPKFSGFAIVQAINDELRALSSPATGLYRERTMALDYEAGTDGYDLASDVLDILDVSFDANDGTGRWPSLTRSGWRLQRGLNTADYPSGMALMVNGWAEPGRPVRVTYKAPFSATLAAGSDVVETVTGITDTAVDILPLGAAIRLLMGTEVARNFLDQGETRRADEVPPGARGQSPRGLMTLRKDRIAEEAARLYAKWPVVR